MENKIYASRIVQAGINLRIIGIHAFFIVFLSIIMYAFVEALVVFRFLLAMQGILGLSMIISLIGAGNMLIHVSEDFIAPEVKKSPLQKWLIKKGWLKKGN